MSLQDFRLRSSGAFFLGHPGVEDCAPDPAGIASITTRTSIIRAAGITRP
jgi:hypothetical protein